MKTKECDHEVVFNFNEENPGESKHSCLICGLSSGGTQNNGFTSIFIDYGPWTFWKVWELLGDVEGWHREKGLILDEAVHKKTGVCFGLEFNCISLRRIGSIESLYHPGILAYWAFIFRCRKIKKHLGV